MASAAILKMGTNEHFIIRTTCPACLSGRHRELFTCAYTDEPIRSNVIDHFECQGHVEMEYLEGASYTLDECVDCGLIFQREAPGEALSARIYEQWIDPARIFSTNKDRFTVRLYEILSREILSVMKHFNRPPGELRFLDFGMGWGEWCRLAGALGVDARGLELSMSRKAYVQKYGIEVIGPGDLHDNEYDLIYANQVFEHLAEPLEALKSLAGSIKDDGLIWITVPDGRGMKSRIPDMDWRAPEDEPYRLTPVGPIEHLNCFTRGSLVAMGMRAGLKPVSLSIVNVYLRHIMHTTMRDLARPLMKWITGLGVPSVFFKRA